MRTYIAYAVVIALAVAAIIQPAMAFSEISIPFITTDCFVYTFPNSNTALTIAEFNSATQISNDTEALKIDFPLFTDGIVAGPTVAGAGSVIDGAALGTGATANVLPFGLVDLAFPSIFQNVNQNTACQRTYFFTDTISS